MRESKKEKSLFSERLLRLRKLRGLTQQQLADKLNTSVKNICYYETIAQNPTSKTLNLLANSFDVPESYFLEKNNKHKPGPKSIFEDKINQLQKLPTSQQKTVLAILDGVLEKL